MASLSNSRELVVLVGAGASHGARETAPPLGKELLQHIQGVAERSKASVGARLGTAELEALDKAFALARGLKTDSFEDLAAHLLSTRSELQKQPSYGGDRYRDVSDQLRALNRCVAAAMSGVALPEATHSNVDDPFVEKPDRYDDLIALLWRAGGRASTAFISLNYDTLLEAALKRDNKKHEARSGEGLHSWYDWDLLKPHGSVNFWGAFATTVGPKGYCYDRVHIGEPFSELSGPKTGPIPMRAPVMAYFAPGKPGLINAEALEEARQRSVEAAARCKRALIVGVHIPTETDDDPPLMKILASLREKRVLYLAGPPRIGDTDAAMAEKQYGFQTRLSGFADGVRENGVIQQFLQQR